MIAPLRILQELVLTNASISLPVASTADPFLVRVQDALQTVREAPGRVGPSDLAILLRQGMLRCALARGEQPELRVPKGPPWPDDRIWRLFSCEVRGVGSAHYIVRAGQWAPAWLDLGAPVVIEDAIKEKPRRQFRPVMADPSVIDYTGHQEYSSLGQREAVRAAFLMPGGSTLIVNLPTGAGKTLVFQLPALTWASEGGLTFVVVPTVALARDQEDRFRELLAQHQQAVAWSGIPLAYFGGLEESLKSDIRSAIRNGGTPIVFASPEAATGVLRGPLFDAARKGRLRLFAIDEAHIISQWGQQFRPEFQSIAGLRDALLDACPQEARFRTLLLTATLTPETYQTLQQLFGKNNSQMVSATSLRPEPGYLISSPGNEPERCEHVLEAIRHLPRPLILYTTLREHAENWYAILRNNGFRRLSLVRGGDLADADGERILRDWRDRALDVIVATSAFGLGVDQSEVRSVVHACLPENIDRYYQEVGRSGRDGSASVALLVSTPQDVHTAEGLAREKLISVDRAFERWEAMWVHRRNNDDENYILSLDERPPDIHDTGVRNAAWNLRTLVLMGRTGLIEFTAHPPPPIDREPTESDTVFEERCREASEGYSREVSIQICDTRHSDKTHWDEVVARKRTELRAADEEAFLMVRELRDLQRPLNKIFSGVYSLSDPIVRPPRFLGSCPITRRLGTASFQQVDPDVTTLTKTDARISDRLVRALIPCCDSAGRSWIAYHPVGVDAREKRRWRERLLSLLRNVVSGGIVELSIPDGFLREEDWLELRARAPLHFLLRATVDISTLDTPFTQGLPVPRLTLLGQQRVGVNTVESVMRICRPQHIIVLPSDLPDPFHPNRGLFDILPHISIEEFLSRLES